MGLWRDMFGPSREELWGQLAAQIDGKLTNEGSLFKDLKLRAEHGPWTITLDTFARSTGKSATPYTRLRAPFCNPGGLRFTIFRKSIFSGLGKLLGMQDIEVGEPWFDDDFIIKGNCENEVRRLFANGRIRELLQGDAKRSHLMVKDDEGWFGRKFPPGVDELYLETVGHEKNIHRLRNMFDLFAEVLDELTRMGTATQQSPKVRL